jgi:hypothetical protein
MCVYLWLPGVTRSRLALAYHQSLLLSVRIVELEFARREGRSACAARNSA